VSLPSHPSIDLSHSRSSSRSAQSAISLLCLLMSPMLSEVSFPDHVTPARVAFYVQFIRRESRTKLRYINMTNLINSNVNWHSPISLTIPQRSLAMQLLSQQSAVISLTGVDNFKWKGSNAMSVAVYFCSCYFLFFISYLQCSLNGIQPNVADAAKSSRFAKFTSKIGDSFL